MCIKHVQNLLGNEIKFGIKDTILPSSELCFSASSSLHTLRLEFNGNSLSIASANSLLTHYLFILRQCFQNENFKISDFEIITPEEAKLLEKFNNGKDVKTRILDKNLNPVPIGCIGDVYYLDSKGNLSKSNKCGKWNFDGNIEFETDEKFNTSFGSNKNQNYDFLKSYDYSKADKVLERNIPENYETMIKTTPR
ncbi:MAG: hypothetical protein HFJ50_05880 [Clostridia bacterium]|nr:hypothetical protein [Clostridia bacterium]